MAREPQDDEIKMARFDPVPHVRVHTRGYRACVPFSRQRDCSRFLRRGYLSFSVKRDFYRGKLHLKVALLLLEIAVASCGFFSYFYFFRITCSGWYFYSYTVCTLCEVYFLSFGSNQICFPESVERIRSILIIDFSSSILLTKKISSHLKNYIRCSNFAPRRNWMPWSGVNLRTWCRRRNKRAKILMNESHSNRIYMVFWNSLKFCVWYQTS